MEFESFVLAAVTADLAEEGTARGAADAVEFRLDLARDPLDQLAAYDGELPVIATNRIDSEGGEASDDKDRLEALIAALEYPAVEAVDVELSTVQAGDAEPVFEVAEAREVSVVVSAHDFDGTPTVDAMATTLRAAAAAGDLAKLAVTATGPEDVLDLLGVTWRLSSDGLSVATMAMGEAGRHSRAIAPLYGSLIGYAPVDPASATAPGQYDLETLRGLLDALDVD